MIGLRFLRNLGEAEVLLLLALVVDFEEVVPLSEPDGEKIRGVLIELLDVLRFLSEIDDGYSPLLLVSWAIFEVECLLFGGVDGVDL